MAVAPGRPPPPSPSTPPLLILRALGLGDLLTAVPALRALQAAFPARRRLLACPAALAPLLALVGRDPTRPPDRGERAIDAVVPLPAWVGGALPRAAGDGAALPRGAFAVNLHGSGPHSHRLLLATAPERLIAFACPAVPESADGPPWENGAEHERERWSRLLEAYGIPCDADDLDLPAPPAQAPAATALAGATLLHPGAASAARRWPAGRWSQVARAERRRGRAVVVSGSAAERPLAERVADAAGLPRAAVLAGTTADPLALAALVGAVGRVVCGDTGVAHLATALRTPSVVLFGPLPPGTWGPPPNRPWHRALSRRAGGETAPGDPHAPRPDPALLAITPDAVTAALAELPPAPRLTAAAAP